MMAWKEQGVYKRMLVTLDGSELSEVVFPYAKELAGRLGLEVVLFHVCEAGERGAMALHRAYVDYRADMVSRQSQEVRERVGQGNQAVLVRAELATGYPAEEILRFAESNAIDVILMATHGRSGIRRWVLGSVAEKVLSASRVPVFLVRSDITEKVTYDKWPKQTLLVPLDGSDLGETVLPHAIALAKQRGNGPVELLLLRVCEPPDFVRAPVARCKMAAADYLSGVRKRLEGIGLSVTSEVREGDPATEISGCASKNPFSIIVMATHARSGLSRWVMGSVAAKVLRSVTTPILLVRTRELEAA